VCVCVCVCVFYCKYIYAHIYMNVRVFLGYIDAHIHLYIHTCTHIYVHICTYKTGFGWMVVINALAISLLHEMEHDLIHELYFKKAPWVQHVMFAGIWLIKSNASPWWRKYYHLRHHQYSGQVCVCVCRCVCVCVCVCGDLVD
jgi:hypothetical protein